MSRNDFHEYLSNALGQIDEEYTEDALDFLYFSHLRKKNTRKKLVALAVTMIAVRGITKYIGNKELNFHKSNKGA